MFLGLDWGNSNLRAAVIDPEGAPQRGLAWPRGARSLARDAFAPVLAEVRAALDARQLPALACGAVGAREGWVEAPYVPIPAAPIAVAARLVHLPEARLSIVPGLCAPHPPRAILRGEETQLAGLDLADGLVCLPGTHSKWVRMERGRVAGFRSYLTGELFALVAGHARIATEGDPDDPAGFALGLAAAGDPAPLTERLFALRAERILGALPEAQSLAALAGLLIGAEVAHAAADSAPGPVILCGEPALTGRYARALAHHGVSCREVDGSAAAWRGLARIARAAGVVHG